MTWSDLTQVVRVSPNKSSRDGNKIERITVHHTAGIASADGLLNEFANPTRQASANYVIGNDGVIGGCVPEEYRSWCSGSRENDTRSICIEVSNDVNGEPWSIGKKAWKSAVELCVDICLRYGFKLWWAPDSKTGSLTCHRWYQPTACPGDWFYARIPEFNAEVNYMIDRITTLEKAVADQSRQIKKLTDALTVMGRDVNKIDVRTEVKYDKVSDCPKWLRPTVQKLVDKGLLLGDENGNLGLTQDMSRLLVINDRAGVYDI